MKIGAKPKSALKLEEQVDDWRCTVPSDFSHHRGSCPAVAARCAAMADMRTGALAAP
jgi:hypothetical protein